jgi:hypothetical protein
VKDAMTMSDAEAVRINLSACLRETTQVWYIEDLSDLEKKALRTLEDDADHWCNALLKKFKKFVASALNYLTIERYILNDVRANRNISSFVFQIMRHAKVVNIADLHDQFIWVYNAIVSKLIKDINLLDENISIMTFLKNLKTKKNIWHRIYTRKSTSSRIESEFQTNFSNSSFFTHEQSTYSSRQYLQRQFQQFENDSDSRNYQKFLSQSDNVYQKNKTLLRNQKNISEYNQQVRSSNFTLDQTQSSSFETQSVRNQTIFAWRQNVSQKNIADQTQAQSSAINADVTSDTNRTSLKRYNNEEKEQYQDQEKHDQFRKFYDNREQPMKIYVREENQKNQQTENQFESFEEIDLEEKNDENHQNDQFMYNLNINSSKICKKCDIKRKIFSSNNAFHKHIRVCSDDEAKLIKTLIIHSKIDDEKISIIKSRVKKITHKDYEFRSYQYAIAWIILSLSQSAIEDVANTDCVMSLVDAKYLLATILKTKVMKMSISINVKEIENILHKCDICLMLDLYLDDVSNESKVREHIHKEFHVIDDLKCKLLMKLNIITSEEMIINLIDKSLLISTCENLVILIRINLKSNSRIRRIVHNKISVVISSNSIVSILIYLREKKLSSNKDFLFKSNNNILTKFLDDLDEFYTHVCDCNLAFVHVENVLVKSVMISSKTRLELLTEYEKEECFQIKFELH